MGGIDTQKILPTQSVNVIQKHFSDVDAKTFEGMNHRTRALYFKSQAHAVIDADYIIYVDGKVQVLSRDFNAHIMDALRGNLFAMLKHGERTCIYEEVDYIEDQIKKGSQYLATRYANRPLRNEVEYYRREGYPANNGLNDCSIFAYKVEPYICRRLDEWWDMIKDNKTFDQTAIQYVMWRSNVKIAPIVFKDGMYKLVKHLKVI